MKAVVYRANFAGANLSDTLFDRAVLNEADLTGAILQRAVLTRSDLGGAKITGAGGRDGGERRGLADPARARPGGERAWGRPDPSSRPHLAHPRP